MTTFILKNNLIYIFLTFCFSLLGKGAVAASMLGYVLPGVLYLSTYKKEARQAWNDVLLYFSSHSNCERDNVNVSIIERNSHDAVNNRNNVDNNDNNNSNDDDDNNESNCDNNAFIINITDNDSINNNDNNDSINNNGDNNDNKNDSINNDNSSDQNGQNVNNFNNFRYLQHNKTFYNLFQALYPFFLPIFMIIFGFLSMVIGVSSIILF